MLVQSYSYMGNILLSSMIIHLTRGKSYFFVLLKKYDLSSEDKSFSGAWAITLRNHLDPCTLRSVHILKQQQLYHKLEMLYGIGEQGHNFYHKKRKYLSTS